MVRWGNQLQLTNRARKCCLFVFVFLVACCVQLHSYAADGGNGQSTEEKAPGAKEPGPMLDCADIKIAGEPRLIALMAEHNHLHKSAAVLYLQTYRAAIEPLKAFRSYILAGLSENQRVRLGDYQARILNVDPHDFAEIAAAEETITDIRLKIQTLASEFMTEIHEYGGLKRLLGGDLPPELEPQFALHILHSLVQGDLVFSGQGVVEGFDLTIRQRISLAETTSDPFGVAHPSNRLDSAFRLLEHNIEVNGADKLMDGDNRLVRKLWELRQEMVSIRESLSSCGVDIGRSVLGARKVSLATSTPWAISLMGGSDSNHATSPVKVQSSETWPALMDARLRSLQGSTNESGD